MTVPIYYSSGHVLLAAHGAYPNEIAVIDANGDGHLDLVMQYSSDGLTGVPVRIALGDGDGGFTDGTSDLLGDEIPLTWNPRQLVTADFNGDGRLDVYTADHGYDGSPFPGALDTLMLSSGLTGFVDATANIPPIMGFSHSASAGDIDGDGDQDLIVGSLYPSHSPYFLINDGSANFTENVTQLPDEALLAPSSSYFFFDADGDGDADLFSGSTIDDNQHLPGRIWENDGQGGFHDVMGTLPTRTFNGNAFLYDHNVEAADLNGDGLQDLIVAVANGDIFYQALINRGGGRFTDESQARFASQPVPVVHEPTRPVLADVNGDGAVDVVVQSSSNAPVFLNDGSGHFFNMPTGFWSSDNNQMKAYAGDYNEDGRVDFLVWRDDIFNWPDRSEHLEMLLADDPDLTQVGDGADNGLLGDESAESFSGLSGDDVIFAGGGNDTALGGNGADTIVAGAGADSLNGAGGSDFLAGGAGNDSIDGGAAIDTASYRDATAGVAVSLAKVVAQNTQGAGSDSLVSVENVIGSSHDDTLTGSVSANHIEGGEAHDKLSGGDGDDTLQGGMGDDKTAGGAGADTASYADAASGVTVTLAKTMIQNTLGAGKDKISGIEILVGSAFADRLTGSSLANTLVGGDGNDILQGGKGDDRLIGGNGIDIVSFGDAVAAVTLTFKAGSMSVAGLGADTLSSIEGVMGSRFADKLTGSAAGNLLGGGDGADTVNGGKGDDTLRGGLGDDRLVGGSGFDIADFSDATKKIAVNLAISGPQNTGAAGHDTLLAIEAVQGSAFGDKLTGNGAANAIYGEAGDDTLEGGDGVDTLTGGEGDDVIHGAVGNDEVDGGLGTDTISFAGETYGCWVNLELGLLDLPDGTRGSITGVENVRGSDEGSDSITGNLLNNIIDLGLGGGFCQGQEGADTLIGGEGADVFGYALITHSSLAAADLIINLSEAQGDRIDINGVDANSTQSGDQAFVFSVAFTHKAGQLVRAFDAGSNLTTFSMDIDGDALADMVITAEGDQSGFSNFTL